MDDTGDQIKNLDDSLLEKWVEKYVIGDYKFQYIKDGTIKSSKGCIIKGFEGEYFPSNLKFKTMGGDFIIEKCPNLKSIEGLFYEGIGFIGGRVSISNCPSLVSIKGLPGMIEGSLSLINNKLLKTLDGMPEYIHGNISIMKCGRSFKESEILKRLWNQKLWPGSKIYADAMNDNGSNREKSEAANKLKSTEIAIQREYDYLNKTYFIRFGV